MLKKKNEKAKDESKEESAEAGQGEQRVLGEDSNVGDGSKEPSEKEKLLDLYKTLKDLGINSIGDLEVMISRL